MSRTVRYVYSRSLVDTGHINDYEMRRTARRCRCDWCTSYEKRRNRDDRAAHIQAELAAH